MLLLLVGGAALWDHRLRDRDATRVRGCVAAATSSVRFTSARVDAIASYVRPALDGAQEPATRRRFERIVSRAVESTVPDVRRARERCTAVQVAWLHRGAEARRQDCLRLLQADLDYLDAVIADGARAFGTRTLPAGSCTED